MSRCPGAGFPCGSEGLPSSTKFSLNSCSQSGNSCNGLLCISSPFSFLFLLLVSEGLCSGVLRKSALVLPLVSIAGFSVPITESCDEDVEEVCEGDVEQLINKPGTTSGDRWSSDKYTHDPQALRVFLQEA